MTHLVLTHEEDIYLVNAKPFVGTVMEITSEKSDEAHFMPACFLIPFNETAVNQKLDELFTKIGATRERGAALNWDQKWIEEKVGEVEALYSKLDVFFKSNF